MKKLWLLIKLTVNEWKEDKAPRLAAALAYYAGFSMAPVLVIAIAVASLFYDRQVVQELVIEQMGGLAGTQGGELINTMLEASRDFGSNLLAAGLGIVALILGATGVFVQMQDAMNTMWEVTPKPDRGVLGVLKKRIFSFAMVVSVGFLLLVSLVVSTALAALRNWGLDLFPGFETLIQIANLIISLLVITVLYALLFKYVPDAQVQWKDVWLGALVTATLFTIGKSLIGFYLGKSNIMDQFGGAGALVIILVWVYYSAQISFLGAEFTQVYANTYGSRVVPDETAVSLSDESRLEQGIPKDEQLFEAIYNSKSPNQEINPVAVSPIDSVRVLRSLPNNEAQPVVIQALVGSFIVTTLVSLVSGFLLGNSGKSK